MDLLQTGKYGVLANQQLLGTTSNNITNVNTEGYVRQQTSVYTSAIDWGVGTLYTRRLYDRYVQREMFRDQGNVGFYDAYASGLGTVDKLLSGKDTAISTSLDSFFSSMQSAVQNTTSVASRRELLTQLQNMVDRYHTLSYNISNELTANNARVEDTVSTINDLTESIFEINQQVRNLVGKSGEQSDIGLQLQDERDRLINQLSEYVDLNVTTESDGSLSLYMGNGQLLVNGDTYGYLKIDKDSFDSSSYSVSLHFDTPKHTEIQIGNETWGGKLGGYLSAGDDIRQAKRDLGQMAIAFADALNEQNKGGITLENKAGGDLISIPSVAAKTNNNNYSMELFFNDGEGADVRNCDYKVIFDRSGGVPEPIVYMIDENGKAEKVDPDLVDVSHNADGKLEIKLEGHGVTMKFSDSLENLANVPLLEFRAQPVIDAAFNIQCNITKPEEFAFASAIRTNTGKHAGSAVASLVGVTGTGPGMGLEIGADGLPALKADAPNYVRYEKMADGTEVFVVYHADFDADGNPTNLTQLGTAPADCNGENIFAHTTWNTTRDEGYPGYEVSFTGTFVNGSDFSIEINRNGDNDNSNGNLMAQLQQEDLVHGRTGDRRCSFIESYADLTADVGSAVMSATTDLAASTAKCEQTRNLFYSTAGVNLDEEAANLIRYQQSYSACAKIINASQTVFDALISAI